jgi:hypothetical protein
MESQAEKFSQCKQEWFRIVPCVYFGTFAQQENGHA